jgi:heat shock protein HslJ
MGLLVTAVFLVGCNSVQSEGEKPAAATKAVKTRKVEPKKVEVAPANTAALASRMNADYKLTRLVQDGQEIELPPASSVPITLRFTAPGRIAGQSAVNRFFGSYQLRDDGTLQWPNAALGMTRMAGSEAAMALENQFTRALTATTRLNVGEDRLRFQNDDGSILLEFVQKP